MPVMVMLVDDDSAQLVECADTAEAARLGAAAVWSNGGVSAYLIDPTKSRVCTPEMIEALKGGAQLGEF